MHDLIERLEKATEPDRELDHAIDKIANGEWHYYALEYTRSIDAALTLVPENYGWDIEGEEVDGAGEVSRPSCAVWHFGKDPFISERVFAATPAIALCIAALKTREASNA